MDPWTAPPDDIFAAVTLPRLAPAKAEEILNQLATEHPDFDRRDLSSVIGGSLDLIAETVARAGLSAVLCYEITDRNGVPFNFKSPYDQEHFALLEAIRQDAPFNEGHYGATSSFTAVLGRMATYSGKIVTWDEAVAKGQDLAPGLADYGWDTTPPIVPDDDGIPI